MTVGVGATEMADYRLLSAHGVRLALGTDSPLVPVGLSPHLVLRALHTHGYSPTEALHSASTVPARLFARDDLGTVQPGKRADLVVIDGDPFTDFTTLISTALTVHDGIVHQAEALIALRPPGPQPPPPGMTWPVAARRLRHGACCDHTPHPA
ncbi:amidohydrolase family protein [Streptomyces flaveolus]|uniref:amidohydrolase family protein n=1 Tax=Streptomyces flaveolus TaxID=67297 RepID=UPI00340BC165